MEEMTGYEALRFFAALRGIRDDCIEAVVDDLTGKLFLHGSINNTVKEMRHLWLFIRLFCLIPFDCFMIIGVFWMTFEFPNQVVVIGVNWALQWRWSATLPSSCWMNQQQEWTLCPDASCGTPFQESETTASPSSSQRTGNPSELARRVALWLVQPNHQWLKKSRGMNQSN